MTDFHDNIMVKSFYNFPEQPTAEDDPTPTSAHIRLKSCVEKLIDDVTQNPLINVSIL